LSDVASAEAARAAPSPTLALGLGERARAWPLALVLAVSIGVSTVYNVRVPLYEAPDEIAHARYVKTIAEEGTLPRFSSSAEYESWQPPLYYAVGAAALKILALDSPPELDWNPNFPTTTRQNFLHTPDEDFPYSEPVLAVHVLRGVTTLFSTGTIIVIYLTALLVFSDRRLLALCAAATASLVPQFAFLSGTVNNDAASVFFAAGTVYFGLRYLRDVHTIWLVLAAIAVSLGALTKVSTLMVAVVPVAAVSIQSSSWRQKAPYLALVALLPLLAAGWFYLRSLILWGAIYPTHLFWPLDPRPIWDPAYRRFFLEELRDSFWYIGGPMSIRISPIIYDALNVTSVLALGGVIVAFTSSHWSRFQRRSLALLLLLPFLALAMVIYISVAHHYQAQGRYLFAAMPAFAILMPLGIGALFSRDTTRDHPAMLALPALLLAVNVSIFTITLPRYY